MAEAAEINFTNLLNQHFETMITFLYKYIQSQNYTVEDLNTQMVQQCLIGQEAIDEEEAQATEEFDQDEDYAPISPNEYVQIKNKSIEIASDLMVKIVIQDLKREPFESKTLKFLKSFDSSPYYNVDKKLNEMEKSFLQIQIVLRLLNYFLKNPKVQ